MQQHVTAADSNDHQHYHHRDCFDADWFAPSVFKMATFADDAATYRALNTRTQHTVEESFATPGMGVRLMLSGHMHVDWSVRVPPIVPLRTTQLPSKHTKERKEAEERAEGGDDMPNKKNQQTHNIHEDETKDSTATAVIPPFCVQLVTPATCHQSGIDWSRKAIQHGGRWLQLAPDGTVHKNEVFWTTETHIVKE